MHKGTYDIKCSEVAAALPSTASPYLGPIAAAAAAESLQSCPTLCNPKDCSLPGSSVHGILQARVLEWGAIAFSGSYCNTGQSHFLNEVL